MKKPIILSLQIFILGMIAEALPAQVLSDVPLKQYKIDQEFSIKMPHKPSVNSNGDIKFYAASAPLFPTPPHKFYFVCLIGNQQNKDWSGDEQFTALKKRQNDLIKAIGGRVLEHTPIRWNNYIGLRTISTHQESGMPVPTTTVAYSLWLAERIVQISYGELNFYGDQEISSHHTAAEGRKYFRTFEATNNVNSTKSRTPLKQTLEGSWVVRQAWVGSKLDLKAKGTEYTFNSLNGTFRRLSSEKRQSGQVADPHLTYPSYGKYVVNHDAGHLDFHDEPLIELEQFTPALYRIKDEVLELRIGTSSEKETNRPLGFDSLKKEKSGIYLVLSRPGDNRQELQPSKQDEEENSIETQSIAEVLRERVKEREQKERSDKQLSRQQVIRLAKLWHRIKGDWKFTYTPLFGSSKLAFLDIEPRMKKPEYYQDSEPDSRHARMKGNVSLTVSTIRPISTGLTVGRLPLEVVDGEIRLQDQYQDLTVIIYDVDLDSDDIPQQLKVRLEFKDGKPVGWIRSGRTLLFTKEDKAE